MPCNTGTSLVPIVNGEVYRFRAAALYNGLVLMGDDKTDSLWEHVTGECVRGEHQGYQVETHSARYMTVAQVLLDSPHAVIAISMPTLKSRIINFIFLRKMLKPEGFLPGLFYKSMTEADARLSDLEIGLGVWVNGAARFYPLKAIRAQNNAFVDTLGGKQIVIYIDPISQVPAAHCSSNAIIGWDKNDLVLSSGERIQNGHVLNAAFQKQELRRPNQQFTRWYGFSYLFPSCEIYEEDLAY